MGRAVPTPIGPSRPLVLAAFPAPDEDGASGAVKIALLEGERFADPHPRAPQQDNQSAKSVTVRAVADRAHDGDDLLNSWWIGRVLLASVAFPWLG